MYVYIVQFIVKPYHCRFSNKSCDASTDLGATSGFACAFTSKPCCLRDELILQPRHTELNNHDILSSTTTTY